MAQRKAKTTGEELNEPEYVAAAEEFELEKFLEDNVGSIAKVLVFRVSPKGDLEQVATVGVDGLDEETLRENYGAPATYSLRFKDSNGKFRAEKRIKLGVVKLEPKAANGSGVSGLPNPAAEMFKMQIDMMQARAVEQAQLTNTLLAGLVNRPQQQGADPAAMLAALVTAFSTLQGAVIKTAPEDPIEKFKSMFALVKEMLPGGGVPEAPAEDNPWSVVKEIGARAVDMARPFIERAASAAIIPQGPPQQYNPGAPVPALPAAKEEVPMKTALQWVREGIAYLKDKAKAQKDPELFIEFILDNGEEMQWAALIGAVKQGVTFEQLLQFDSDIAQNPTLTEWFKNVFDGIHAELFPNGNTQVDSSGKGGDGGNAASDGGASATGPGKSGGPVAGG